MEFSETADLVSDRQHIHFVLPLLEPLVAKASIRTVLVFFQDFPRHPEPSLSQDYEKHPKRSLSFK